MTREEQAKKEIGSTAISRGVAWFLTIAYVTIIFGVVVVEYSRAVWQRHQGVEPQTDHIHAVWTGLGQELESAWSEAPTWIERALAPNRELLRRISTYENALDDRSWIVLATKSPVQVLMAHLGVGNEKAAIGRDGWLFYKPDITHATGRGFLEPTQLLQRSREHHAPQPDPVLGIVHFRDELAALDMELVVVPTPVKPTVSPHKLSRRAAPQQAVNNQSHETFLERLAAEGVRVWNPVPALFDGPDEDVYLLTDTHWRPSEMRRVAERLADDLVRDGLVSGRGEVAYGLEPVRIEHYGDIRVMLGLPDESSLFPAESVEVERVLEEDGAPWENRTGGEVLLLGDSFTNIYAFEEMKWGDAAGFAEHLSHALAMPVERISRNDAGSYATREMLAADRARGRDRLDGKRVVVWQFATRELSQGDWRLVSLPELGESRAVDPERIAEAVEVVGTVDSVSNAPHRDATYADFIMKFYVTGLERADGEPHGEGDGILHVRAMRNREILPVAEFRADTRIRARIVDWESVEDRYGAIKSGSLDDTMLELEKDYFYAEMLEPKP